MALVCAAPGGGKTRVAKQAAEKWKRVVVFDPFARRDRVNAARGDAHRQPWPGVLVTPAQLFERPFLLDRSPLRLVVSPEGFDAKELARDFAGLARVCWHTGGGIVLVAEEAAIYGRAASDAILRIAAGGAHGGLSLVLICQSLGRVPIDGRRHVSLVVAGPQGETTDLEELRARCGPEFARKVRALKKGDSPAVWRVGDAL